MFPPSKSTMGGAAYPVLDNQRWLLLAQNGACWELHCRCSCDLVLRERRGVHGHEAARKVLPFSDVPPDLGFRK